MITDIDLVLEQIRIAAGGRPCRRSRRKIAIIGHAHRMPDQLRKKPRRTFPSLAGQDHAISPRRAASASGSISAVYQGYVIPAPITNSLVGQTDRPRPRPAANA